MSCNGIIGSITEKHVEIYFEWTIPDFKSLTVNNAGDYFDSPPFLVSGCSWFLRMHPQSREHSGFISLYLHKEETDQSTQCVTFTLGTKNSYGSLDETDQSSHVFSRNQLAYGKTKFRNRSNLPDKLVLTCRIKPDQPRSMEVPARPVKLAKLETLSSNLRDLYTSKMKYDATIRVKNKEFQVHRAVLSVRSKVFAAMFQHSMSEKETGVVSIEDCDPDSFGNFLEYLYTGKIEQKELSFDNVRHLYVTADKYDVKELKSFCVAYLMQSLTAETFCDVVTVAEQYGDVGLKEATQNFFNRNANKILQTSQWEELLKDNHLLANRLFMEMASRVKTDSP